MTLNQFLHGWILRLVLVVLISLTASKATASDWHLGILTNSYHPLSDTFNCNGVETDYNETNPGIFVRYKYLLVGRFENSMSGCDGAKWSNLLGVEADLGATGPIHWSVTAALTDGYPEFENPVDDFGEYKVWGSINARVGILKINYSYLAIAFGLEFPL